LRLAEPVGAEADLQDGNGRRTVLHHNRRLSTCRQQCANRIRSGDDLRDRQIEVHVGLEIKLLHRNTVDGFGFNVLDAVDVGADRVLAVSGKALLHLGRVEAGVLPDHRNHWDVDLGEYVGRHLDRRRHPEE
jgi:hypothetical protein